MAAVTLSALFLGCLPIDDLQSHSVGWALHPTRETPVDAGDAGDAAENLGDVGVDSGVTLTRDIGSGAELTPSAGDVTLAVVVANGVTPDAGVAPDAGVEAGTARAASSEDACERDEGTVGVEGATCLIVKTEKRSTFDDALQDCEANFGGALAKVADRETDELVRMMMQEAEAGVSWIGLAADNRSREGEPPGPLEWVDGEAYEVGASFGNWAEDEPDRNRSQACVAKRVNQAPGERDPVGTWYDQECTWLFSYVCERPLD